MLDEKRKERLLQALLNHEHTYVYKSILSDSRSDVVEFSVEEALRLVVAGDKSKANDILMTLVHCQVEPQEVVAQAFNQGSKATVEL